ncbi:AEC family transporter [Romeriopsis navalis]|nr:AEC family transporter [Romeriopsis navalis]
MPLVMGVLIGWLASYWLPKQTPVYLGKGLFLFGVPISVFVFLRQTDRSDSIWLAGVAAWGAMLTGLGLMYWWLRWGKPKHNRLTAARSTQGTILLASMVGNTGYLGLPIALSLFGNTGFAWALFYDLLGTTLGAYGVGAMIASRYGPGKPGSSSTLPRIWQNPTLWTFMLALIYQDPLPEFVEQGLRSIAWGAISLALILIGMRLGQLTSLHQIRQTAIPLGLKMLLLPLLIWGITAPLPIPTIAKQVIVLQTAMPPAFATLVLAESYSLDPEFAVALIATGTGGLLFTLPLWLWLTGLLG